MCVEFYLLKMGLHNFGYISINPINNSNIYHIYTINMRAKKYLLFNTTISTIYMNELYWSYLGNDLKRNKLKKYN